MITPSTIILVAMATGKETVRAMGSSELGIQLVFIPEQYDGMGGGAFDVYRVCEAMARIDVGIATGVLATFLGSDPIVFGGTEEQRKHWLSRIAAEGTDHYRLHQGLAAFGPPR